MGSKDQVLNGANVLKKETILKDTKTPLVSVGRPTKNKSEKASESLQLKLTLSEKEALLAGADGIPLSSWVKNELRKNGYFGGC